MQTDWLQIDRNNLREGQRNAIDTILLNVRKGKQNTAISLPPGYGKSDVVRVSATMLMCQQLVSCALVLVPAENLRNQVIDARSMQAATDRYNLPRIRGQRISAHEIKEYRLPFPPPRHKNDNFFAATIQLANSNLLGFVRWVVQEKQENGVPPIVFVDEAHTSSASNQWGNVVRSLREAGAFVVLLTGTPYRSDRDRIEGFDWEPEETKPVRISRPRMDAHGEQLVDIYEGNKTIYRLKPDYEHTLRQAWDADLIPSLCKMTRLACDFDLDTKDGVTDEHIGSNALSQLPPYRLAGQLGDMLRDDKVIEYMCDVTVTQLRDRRRDAHDVAGIIFVGNDRLGEDPEANYHARRVEEIIRSIDPRLRTIVATSNDSNGARNLRDFQRGDGDILVVKQMGGVGYDVPRLKVELDLSVVRAATAFVQRVARVARVWNPTGNPKDAQETAVYITPDDMLGAALWQHFIAAENGETSLTNAEYVETVQARRDADGQRQGVFERHTVSGVKDADFYSDTNMQVSPKETLPEVQRVVRAIPLIQRVMTLPGVANSIPDLREALAIPEPRAPVDDSQAVEEQRAQIHNEVLDADAEEKADRNELEELARKVAEKRLGRAYRGRGDWDYGKTIKEVKWQHKDLCGFPKKNPRDYTKHDVARLRNSYQAELRGEL